MTKTEKAVQLACEMANDSKYGYDQGSRWGPDFDCSSFLIHVWEQAGVLVRAGGATYTGNMRGVFLRLGFADVTAQVNLANGKGLLAGDVLLNYTHHTAMYVGSGKLVQASLNEKGGVTGGQTGDQTGREIAVRSYYNYPWNCVLRYVKEAAAVVAEDKPAPVKADFSVGLPTLRSGDRGAAVKAMQGELIAAGYSCGPDGADGDFGYNTKNAVTRFQAANALTADGICGRQTRSALLGVL